MSPDFRRLAIVNRGEAAMRLVHGVRDYNEAHGTAIRTIALYTEPDCRAMFVREADEAVALGPATYLDERDGQRKVSYLDLSRLEGALTACGADAVWVGWGFVAERAEFVELCERRGIVFLGPSAAVMRQLGDKIRSKLLAERCGVPVAPWSGGPVRSVAEARAHAERLGFPLVIKASGGGGGRGIRVISLPAELDEAFRSAQAEAGLAFGDSTVFLERLVSGARHVEVQVVGDGYGTVWAVGVRDCTVQRRNQKVLEEAPSPALTPDEHRFVLEAARRLCAGAGYQGAGTVEFLFEAATRRFAFMEVNARLQVEHPVTEVTTGLDLVQLQIHVARGGRLEGEPPPTTGHAIEARLNAENPEDGFAPAPGLVELFRVPVGPGVRVDTGVAQGDEIPPEFDSMVAKIIAWGRDRREALARLRRALAGTTVMVRGGTTNRAFLLDLLRREAVQSGELDNTWLDVLAATGEHVPRSYGDVALLAAAIENSERELALALAELRRSAARGRPVVPREEGCEVELRHRGQSYRLTTYKRAPGRYRVVGEGQRVDVAVETLGPFERRLACFGRRFRVVSIADRLGHLVEVENVPHRISLDEGGLVRAPAPAVVVKVLVQPGDQVGAGDPLVVIEAMKMEVRVTAPSPGRVKQVVARENAQVPAGAPLLILEPGGDGEVPAGERIAIGASGTLEEDAEPLLGALRRHVLGYDVDPLEAERLGGAELRRAADRDPATAELLAGEQEVLEIVADIASVLRRHVAHDEPLGEQQQTAEEHLLSYLGALDRGLGRLPQWFQDSLLRTLRHYGIDEPQPGAALEEALYRIVRAQQRFDHYAPAVMAILDRWLDQAEHIAARAPDSLRLVLERLMRAAEPRHRQVADLAQEAHYRLYVQPAFEAARSAVLREAEAELTALERDPDAASSEERIARLVACPQPLKTLITSRFPSASLALQRRMLEVITRRYYRQSPLADIRSMTVGGRALATAAYEVDGQAYRVVTAFAMYDDLAAAIESASAVGTALVESSPGEIALVVDIYAWRPQGEPDVVTTARDVAAVLTRLSLPSALARVVVAVSGPGRGPGMAGVEHLTFRRVEDRFEEEETLRGLHPMMARRLHLWRLAHFRIERLPSVEDVYLFRAVARDNPRDERLVAMAEVRDLTPIRDEQGRVVSLPHLERMLSEALAGIRLYRSHLPEERRPEWNRVLLYVWPVVEFSIDEIQDIVHRLAPATEGLGMHKVDVLARLPDPAGGPPLERVLSMSNPAGRGVVLRIDAPLARPISPLGEYEQKVAQMRRRGMVYPYEIVRMLTPPEDTARTAFPPGDFVEHDLAEDHSLQPVDRPWGRNTANVVVGVIRNFTAKHPEGLSRVIVLGDPSRGLGSLAEPECRRIIAALDLAEARRLPVEWFAHSSGARISMTSGVENMDWIGRVLRRIVTFTQAGGEINVVVNGINVGAQPYWNAEATMLMHTRGILVMTPEGAMVLTGKQALDYSGGVSAEDNFGIGGYDRVMGPNGQAQYWVRDLTAAGLLLLRHYELSYVVPGERFPRRRPTSDPHDRDVCAFPHPSDGGYDFRTVGEVFSDEHNPGRKKPFDIRTVMRAAIDADDEPLERWAGMADAETAVIWAAHVGGYPVCLVGIESHPVPRRGFVPGDGPDQWTAGTLFPLSSKKVARAINAARGRCPVVVLANLSGFDGSPESMRKLQLEYGAEIGRAVVNFDGPVVFCVISRYHGGAFVVFSNTLNDCMEVAALEGSYASVIGGAPAAAVVFAREVDTRTNEDPRVKALEAEVQAASGPQRAVLRDRLAELRRAVRAEKLGQVADEFDAIHSVQRAQRVGAVHVILPPARLRPYLIDALERGMARCRGEQGVVFPLRGA